MTKRAVRAGFIVDRRDATGMTLLMEAARQGQYERLLQCIEEGSDINAIDYAGNNALMHALQNKQDTIAIVLMNNGIDAAKQTPGGSTPLIEACNRQMPEVIERLLKKKVPLDAQTKQGNTALMLACSLGDGWAACRLAEEGADIDTLKNARGATALAIARRSLRPEDLACFEAAVEKRRAQEGQAALAAAEQKQREDARKVVEATVLQRDIRALKPVAFRRKAP